MKSPSMKSSVDCDLKCELRLGRERQMVLDDGDGHDVEDAPGISVLRIRQFLVAGEVIVGDLYLAVHPPPVRAFEIDPVVAVSLHSVANDWVGHLLVSDLLDVERFLV